MGFLTKAKSDHRIGPHHVALYLALFQQWCAEDGAEPLTIDQHYLRQVAKIGRTSYHKCLHELHRFGYIRYIPSYSPVLGSLVFML